jgi:peptide deformylase
MTPLEVAKNYQAGLEACPELVHAGDPILRRRIGGGVAAEDEADEIFALLKDVLGRFRAATGFGRGLAATQIGIPARAFVTFLNDEWRLWLNPSVLGASAARTLYRESCLSCGPISVDVARPSEIEAFWTDAKGHMYRETLAGFEARLFQHELGHFEGELCVDIAEPRSLQLRTEDPLAETFRPIAP